MCGGKKNSWPIFISEITPLVHLAFNFLLHDVLLQVNILIQALNDKQLPKVEEKMLINVDISKFSGIWKMHVLLFWWSQNLWVKQCKTSGLKKNVYDTKKQACSGEVRGERCVLPGALWFGLFCISDNLFNDVSFWFWKMRKLSFISRSSAN